MQLSDTQEEKDYININGEDVEFVIDEYENPYLKYNIGGKNLYIPFPFETDEEEPAYKPPMFTNGKPTAVLPKKRGWKVHKSHSDSRKVLLSRTL